MDVLLEGKVHKVGAYLRQKRSQVGPIHTVVDYPD